MNVQPYFCLAYADSVPLRQHGSPTAEKSSFGREMMIKNLFL